MTVAPARTLETTPNLSLGLFLLALACGNALLALSSYVAVPMIPVPITMQTLAVTLIGAVFGWRLGTVTVALWLAEAALGWPVLAEGKAGLAVFAGPTAGYLFAFPVAAAACGWLAERGWNGRRPVMAAVNMLAGNALCLALGAAWLSLALGVDKAVAVGVAPFLLGAVLKSGFAAAIMAGIAHFRRREA